MLCLPCLPMLLVVCLQLFVCSHLLFTRPVSQPSLSSRVRATGFQRPSFFLCLGQQAGSARLRAMDGPDDHAVLARRCRAARVNFSWHYKFFAFLISNIGLLGLCDSLLFQGQTSSSMFSGMAGLRFAVCFLQFAICI